MKMVNKLQNCTIDLPESIKLPSIEGLSIRLIRKSDSLEFFELIDRNRVDLRGWLSWVDEVKCVDDISRRNDASLKSIAEGRSIRFFIVFEGSIVGMLAAKRLDWENRLAELSYSLVSAYRGRGFVTVSCEKLMEYLDVEMGFVMYEIATAVGNRSSEKVAEKLGFRLKNIKKNAECLHGEWVDHHVYSKLK